MRLHPGLFASVVAGGQKPGTSLRGRLPGALRRFDLGFGPRLLLTLAISLGVVAAVAFPVVEAYVRDNARQEALRLVLADARGIADVTGAEGEPPMRAVTDLLVAIAQRSDVIDIRLIGPDYRTVASPFPSEIGELEAERSVEEALRRGRTFIGREDEAGDRSHDLQYVVPVEMSDGRYALEVDQDGTYVEDQVVAASRLVLQAMGLAIVACVVVFYVLGGRRLSRLHRAALDRSRRDGLTDLGSQVAFHEDVARAVDFAARHDEPLCLVAFDLDNFKLANDRYGHARGDEILKQVAVILDSCRLADRAFRLGGDEFAVILPRTDSEGAERVCRRLRRELDESAEMRASFGVAELRRGEVDPGALIEQADAAAREVKGTGGDGVLAFGDLRDQVSVVSHAKAQSLSQLLDEGDVDMAFQPVWDLNTGTAIGYEALARPAERYGFSGPAEAFAAAERLRRVPELDALCRQRAVEGAGALPEGVLLFVNLAPQSLEQNPHIDEELLLLVKGAGMSPGRVVVEISEPGDMRGRSLSYYVDRLRGAGFQVALADVGARHCGLDVLRSAVFDFVKIDRRIVTAAVSDVVGRAALLAIDVFARQTGAFVITEGIEDEEVLDLVRHLDEHDAMVSPVRRGGQGFHLGRPGPAPAQDPILAGSPLLETSKVEI